MSLGGGTSYGGGYLADPYGAASAGAAGYSDLPLPNTTDFGTIYASQGSVSGNSDTTTDANVPWWVWLIAGIALLLLLRR